MTRLWSGTLTSHIWAGAVVCTILQQPVLLLWFRIGVPRALGALRRAILHRVVVELKALTLWSQLSLVSTSTVWSCRYEREAWMRQNSALGMRPCLCNGGIHSEHTKSETLPGMCRKHLDLMQLLNHFVCDLERCECQIHHISTSLKELVTLARWVAATDIFKQDTAAPTSVPVRALKRPYYALFQVCFWGLLE